MKKKTVEASKICIGNLMEPQQANISGNVHGGEIMKLMDNTAGIVAHRHARSNTVTARVDGLEFIKPIHIGNLVTFEGRLTFVGKSSMEVLVEVYVEDLEVENSKSLALTGYFTMVALDENGGPKKVPELLTEGPEEEKLFLEGKRRYLARKNR
jgi:acyl-CoA hydrolase